MQEQGYLSQRPRHPAVMAGVIAVHVAGIAGLILFAPEFTQIVEKVLEARPIPLAKDPLPIPDVIRPKIKSPLVKDRIAIEKPTVASKTDDTDFTVDPGPLGSFESGGGAIEIKPIELVRDPVIVSPRFVGRNAQPPYPPGMQRMNIEGSVTVRVLVGVDGRPVRVEAVKVDQDAFFKATRDWAMGHWRFAPATRDGVAFEEWRFMTVTFRMND